jgi:hypothetical protein
VILIVNPEQAPAMGDLRAAGQGDVIIIRREARNRPDWSRLLDAAVSAVGRGATLSVEGYRPDGP